MILKMCRSVKSTCALLILIPFFSAWADQVPVMSQRNIEPATELRVFAKRGDTTYVAELKVQQESELISKSFRLGGSRRIFSHLKIGAYYLLQNGVLHNEDWVQNPDQNWGWRDTSSRVEHALMVEVTPQTVLPSDENWIAECKTRIVFNAFNQQWTLKVRPGVSYLWTKQDRPFLSFFSQLEFYLPLNYGKSIIYETWLYFGALYYYSTTFQLGGYGAWKTVKWESPKIFDVITSQSFEVHDNSPVLGFVAIWNFDFFGSS